MTPEALLANLAGEWLHEGYDEVQQRRDFRQLFFSERGQRVLFQLFMWSNCFEPSQSWEEPTLEAKDLQRIEGRREIGYRILALLYGGGDIKPQPSSGDAQEVSE